MITATRHTTFLLVLITLLGVLPTTACRTGTETPTRVTPTPILPTETLPPLPTSPVPSPTPGFSPVSPLPAPTAEGTESPDGSVPTYSYQVINVFAHDPSAFTQGLVFEDGWLYEGTGRRGYSSLRKVELASGDVVQTIDLPAEFFGEGITIFDDRIIQLTWQSNVGFVYDKDSFDLLQEFQYPTEGWGITHDGARLIMSDGTATLRFLDPETLDEIGAVDVYDVNGPVVRLNELEFIGGELFANVWQTDAIARIDPETGQVTGWVDLTGLLTLDNAEQRVDVLNGIAYDAEGERLFVTGKWWPKLYEIRVVETK